ncbi:hypothetical protein PG997_012459 [Apiospora hydei]|uniref:Uncharacterized protein n=1 Tax=Apiospora hydei TaxID=1337664 RepID=A0ABR1V3H6_9PEZI
MHFAQQTTKNHNITHYEHGQNNTLQHHKKTWEASHTTITCHSNYRSHHRSQQSQATAVTGHDALQKARRLRSYEEKLSRGLHIRRLGASDESRSRTGDSQSREGVPPTTPGVSVLRARSSELNQPRPQRRGGLGVGHGDKSKTSTPKVEGPSSSPHQRVARHQSLLAS